MISERETATPPALELELDELKASLKGPLLHPGEAGYEEARRVWNGAIHRHPALVIRPTAATDVVHAVQFARRHNLEVSIRGGGHSANGHSVTEGGLMIDLSLMKEAQVDPERRTVRAGGGLTWGELDAATQKYGLAVTGGVIATTGIGGLTLAGGFGWLMRQHGLTCDNLLEVEIVTADGRLLTASETENEDLFWAIRGGGGNFGIVTRFVYRLHPVSTVLAGVAFHPVSQAGEVLRFYREYVKTIPENLTPLILFMNALPVPQVPAALRGQPMVGVGICFNGPVEEGEKYAEPVRQFGPPLVDLIAPMPYTTLQTMFVVDAPAGRQYFRRSHYLAGLTDPAIETIAHFQQNTTSPLSHVDIYHLQGALARRGENETAFSNRQVPFTLNILAAWEDPAESERHMRWTKEYYRALKPFSTGAAYTEFMGNVSEKEVKAAYGQNKLERLTAIKTRYDPTNFFHLNHNIKPGTQQGSTQK